MRSVLTGCLPLVVAAGLPSQTTHLVGPGGLPQIRDALAIAAPGDVIHVQPGTYAQFDANVGVTIRALTPGTVTIAYDIAFAPPGCSSNPFCGATEGPTRLQPPAGQVLHVVGLHFAPTTMTTSLVPIRHRVHVTGGRVTFDQCEVRAFETTALTVNGATVHMQATLVATQSWAFGAPGISAANARITATGCSFHGGSPAGIGVGGFPGPGVRLNDSLLHGSHLAVTGGSGSINPTGAPAVLLEGISPVWISDSTLVAGTGQCALQNATSSTRIDRCTLTSNTTGCSTGASSPFLLGVERVAPLQPAATFTLRYRTEPNGFVAIFAGPEAGTVDFGPFLEQPSWLAENTSFVAAVVAADAAGVAVASWPIPNGPFSDLTLWFKGISGFTLPLQASAPAGGVVH